MQSQIRLAQRLPFFFLPTTFPRRPASQVWTTALPQGQISAALCWSILSNSASEKETNGLAETSCHY